MTAGFWWILLSLVLYGTVHSLLASRRFKAVLNRRFGLAADRWHRIIFSILGGLTFLPTLVLVIALPDKTVYSVQAPWSWLLRLVQLTGLIGLVYGVLQTGFYNFIGLDRVLKRDVQHQTPRLVTGGLYRLVRHPLYTATLLALWAAPVLSWNWLALALGVTAYFVIGSKFEEQKLLDEFGSAYEEYRRRTPAFIPRIHPPKA